MMVFEHDGFWQPMDTYRDYSYLNNAVAINKAPWIKW
jgi:glucose-1-phosphate cytidylyltransferase